MGVIAKLVPGRYRERAFHARRWSGQLGKGERMEKRIGHRTMGKLATAAAVGLAGIGAAQQADASLIIDVRATAVNGQPLSAGSTPKDVIAAPGDTVTL